MKGASRHQMRPPLLSIFAIGDQHQINLVFGDRILERLENIDLSSKTKMSIKSPNWVFGVTSGDILRIVSWLNVMKELKYSPPMNISRTSLDLRELGRREGRRRVFFAWRSITRVGIRRRLT